MLLHLFVAEKTRVHQQMLCEAAADVGATRAARVAHECLETVSVEHIRAGSAQADEQNSVTPGTLRPVGDGPFSPFSFRRTPTPCRAASPYRRCRSDVSGVSTPALLSPTMRGSPSFPASPTMRQGSMLSSTAGSDGGADARPPLDSPRGRSSRIGSTNGSFTMTMGGRRRSGSRGRSLRRASSLQRGEDPGGRCNVRANSRRRTRHDRRGLCDAEMPHQPTGLKVCVVVDCALVFAAVTSQDVPREEVLPVLRAVRRDFLFHFPPGEMVRLDAAECRRFRATLDDLLADANRRPGDPVRLAHHELDPQRGAVEVRPRLPVLVNVYNILDPKKNEKFSMFGVGIHHTGVELYGKEWSYGGAMPAPGADLSACGVFCIPPRTALPPSHFKQQILLGTTTKTPVEIDFVVSTFMNRPEWSAQAYHLLTRNCNHFCAEFVRRIGGWDFPGWINRAATLSSAMLPEAVVSDVVQRVAGAPPKPGGKAAEPEKLPRRRKHTVRDTPAAAAHKDPVSVEAES